MHLTPSLDRAVDFFSVSAEDDVVIDQDLGAIDVPHDAELVRLSVVRVLAGVNELYGVRINVLKLYFHS